MAGGDTTTMADLFKEVYDSGSALLKTQQNLYADDFKSIKNSSLAVSPKGTHLFVTMAGNESGGAYSENQTFEQAQSEIPIQPYVVPKFYYWTFQLSGAALDLSEKDPAAAAQSLDYSMKNTSMRMYSDLNRGVFGDGFGVMANVSVAAVAGATTLIVDNTFPFRRNQILDIWTAVGGAKQVTVTVTAVNYDAGTINVTALPANVAINSVIVKKTVLDGAGTTGKEIGGYARMVDTTLLSTTYLNVNVAANPEWKGNLVNALGAPISQDLLQRLFNRVSIVSGMRPDSLISGYGQYRTFLITEVQKTRYTNQNIDAGGIKLKWGFLEWKVSPNCQNGLVYMLNKSLIEKYQCYDPRIASYDGLKVARLDSGDGIKGYYVYRGDLGTSQRDAHGKIYGLQEPQF